MMMIIIIIKMKVSIIAKLLIFLVSHNTAECYNDNTDNNDNNGDDDDDGDDD